MEVLTLPFGNVYWKYFNGEQYQIAYYYFQHCSDHSVEKGGDSWFKSISEEAIQLLFAIVQVKDMRQLGLGDGHKMAEKKFSDIQKELLM